MTSLQTGSPDGDRPSHDSAKFKLQRMQDNQSAL